MNLDEQRLLAALSTDRYKTRRELRHITGLEDRYLRDTISRLVEQGTPILSSSRPDGGYKLANSPHEIRQAIGEYTSRIHSLQRRIKGLEMAEAELIGQGKLPMGVA